MRNVFQDKQGRVFTYLEIYEMAMENLIRVKDIDKELAELYLSMLDDDGVYAWATEMSDE